MRQSDAANSSTRQLPTVFSRSLALAIGAVVLLMAATLGATVWMARQQDESAEAASRRMVAGGLESFLQQTTAMLLDYAIWTDAYDKILEKDVAWIDSNIGSAAEAGTFDLMVVLLPDGGQLGWDGDGGPQDDLLDSVAFDATERLLDGVPIDSGRAETTFVRTGGALWLLATARVVPHDGLPAGITDTDLPRLVFGSRITTALLDGIGQRFMIDSLVLRPEPVPGEAAIPLRGNDGGPLGWASWQPATPGQAVLRATLWPLAGLMAAVGIIVLLVSRELLRSAQRLASALTVARAADRVKSEFLSNVSHELRTPLNGVIGIAQLLQLREHDAEARHMLDLLLGSARSQLQLVNGLLDIARIESGTMILACEPFDPADALDDSVRLIEPEAVRKHLALRLAVAPETPRRILGDALAFRQIVSNLVGNALKFTDRGGIEVELGPDPSGALVLEVTDTGVGIHPTEHARIFERFVQVDGAATRRVGGAGLGLAITRALVELMQGRIEVTSTPGEGTRFTVVLPLPVDETVASAA